MHNLSDYTNSGSNSAAELGSISLPSSPLQKIETYFNHLLEMGTLRRKTGGSGLMSMLIGEAAARAAVLMRLCGAHPETFEGGQSVRPVLYVRVRSGASTKALAKDILEALHLSPPARATEMLLTRMAAASLGHAGVGLLILGNAEQLFAADRKRPGSGAIAWVKAVADSGLCAVMFSGNPAMWDDCQNDGQLRRRIVEVRRLEPDLAFGETELKALEPS